MGLALAVAFSAAGGAAPTPREAAGVIDRPGFESVLEQLGPDGIAVMKHLDEQRVVQLGVMVERGELAAIGRTSELLAVIGKYGNRGMEFVWQHKASLAESATLALFLANPEPFVNGTLELVEPAESSTRPTTVATIRTTQPAARTPEKNNWPFVVALCIAVTAVWLCLRIWLMIRRNRRRQRR